MEEHKHEFLLHGHIPQFQFRITADNIQDITCSKKGQIKFDLLPEATRILENVREEFGCGDRYIEQMYGARIEMEEASKLLAKYLKESGCEGMLTVSWSKDLSCRFGLICLFTCTILALTVFLQVRSRYIRSVFQTVSKN